MIKLRGQSSTEFAAGVAMLGALALGSISIGGIQEVQRRGIVAAREAAFQGEWLRQRGSADSLRLQLGQEHFNDAGLTNATGSSRMLHAGDIGLSADVSGAPGRGVTAVDFLLRPLRAAGGFLGGGFDLRDSGFQSGIVSANLTEAGQMPAPFSSLNLQFGQPYALLGDDWSASGPPHARRRASGLVPTHVLTPIATLWRPLSAPLSLFEPSLRELCFGLIEPDRVPEDRLGPGPRQRVAACP